MRRLQNLTYFANRHRQTAIKAFHSNIDAYFTGLNIGMHATTESDDAKEARALINRRMSEIKTYVEEAGVSTAVDYQDAPIAGGRRHVVDIIDNIFQLHDFQMGREFIDDLLERALGNYEFDQTPALIRTLNPFWWANSTLSALVRVPFKVLGEFGLDTGPFQASILGKILQVVLYLTTVAGSIAAVLQLLSGT
ncbi:hypothetical protein NHF40_12705 [Maricaulaceae bacterium EIL42A08]|nr:hypothetical protein [Maricaulaceae bacterium EIL42A08]